MIGLSIRTPVLRSPHLFSTLSIYCSHRYPPFLTHPLTVSTCARFGAVFLASVFAALAVLSLLTNLTSSFAFRLFGASVLRSPLRSPFYCALLCKLQHASVRTYYPVIYSLGHAGLSPSLLSPLPVVNDIVTAYNMEFNMHW